MPIPFRKLAVPLKRHSVVIPVAPRTGSGEIAVIEIFDSIIFPQRSDADRVVAQTFAKKICRRIEILRIDLLPAQRISCHNLELSGAVDDR